MIPLKMILDEAQKWFYDKDYVNLFGRDTDGRIHIMQNLASRLPIELPMSKINLIYIKEQLTQSDKKFIKNWQKYIFLV